MEQSSTSMSGTATRSWRRPDEPALIRIDAVVKRFGEFVAVDGVSLDIYRGELFCLLGGSGCGKTTLLRMLAGFEVPSSGRIYLEGVDITDLPPYDRPVNMMFQSYALFPHMTVEANVAFGLRQERIARPEIRRRVGEALELVQLSAFAKRKPHQLSGGQRQRVALARSLIKRPKVLLLDEPLAALDKKLREQTQFELMNIQDEVGITFVVVTHDQEEAMTLSTRIAVMDRGRIVQVGTPTEIYEFPETRFTANFIGSINLFEAEVLAGDEPDGLLRAQAPELGCEILVAGRRDLPAGSKVWVAIRPEKIAIARRDKADTDHADAPNRLIGRVKDLGYLGSQSLYRVETAQGHLIKVTTANVHHTSEREVDWGDEVTLSWRPNSVVVLTQ